jgi:serine protease Do
MDFVRVRWPSSTSRHWAGPIASLVTAASLLGAACTSGPALRGGSPSSSTSAGRPSATQPLPAANGNGSSILSDQPVVQVVKNVQPAVVNVTSRTVSADAFGGAQIGKGVGTGFIIRSDGFIVTNFHVVEGALNLKVTLPPPDGRVFSARVIGGDSEHDLAILKVNATRLPTVPLGDSSRVALGERVIAVGYALALPGGPTVTSGILSALQRTVRAQDPNGGANGQGITRTYQDVLQTDAAINPGNSGGPLVDLSGNVIGINTAGNETAQNIGFAIAIDAAKPIIDQAVKHPSSPEAYMGVSTETVDAGVAAQLGLTVHRGALVLAVAPGGPASKTSVSQGDVIVSFDGKPVNTSDSLGTLIEARRPGDKVGVGIVDTGGRRLTVTVTLGVRPLP